MCTYTYITYIHTWNVVQVLSFKNTCILCVHYPNVHPPESWTSHHTHLVSVVHVLAVGTNITLSETSPGHLMLHPIENQKHCSSQISISQISILNHPSPRGWTHLHRRLRPPSLLLLFLCHLHVVAQQENFSTRRTLSKVQNN